REIDDSRTIDLLENGITLLQESTTIRVSKRRVPGRAVITMPIGVQYFTGTSTTFPQSVELPVGDWGIFDSKEVRSLPMEADVTVRTTIKVAGPVATLSYPSAEDCRKAAEVFTKDGKLPDTVTAAAALPGLQAPPEGVDQIAAQESLMTVAASGTHLQCAV